MWLPWRRKPSHRDPGDRGRHRVLDAQAALQESVPTASAAPPFATPPFAAPPFAAPPPGAPHTRLAVAYWPAPAVELAPLSPPGTVGLVFADGSEWLLPAGDDRGEPMRAMAAALSVGSTFSH